MYALFNLFLDICLLRKGPQDVPPSPILLKLTLLAYGVSSLLILLLVTAAGAAIMQALTDILLLAGLTYVALHSVQLSARYTQTLTALAGAGTLLGVLALPLFFWIGQAAQRQTDASLPGLLFLGLIVWDLAVMSHILRHALSVNRWIGLLYALAYFFISIMLRNLLFPVEQ